MGILTPEQISHFKKHGYLKVENLLDPQDIAQLATWVDEVTALPLIQGRQMVYLEDSEIEGHPKNITRIEKFVEEHAELNRISTDSRVVDAVSEVLGEKAILFKDKINFQPPFGGGIAPHQDVQAGWLRYVKDFVSVSITVDESTAENGCTEIDTNWSSEGLIGNLWEPLSDEIMQKVKFTKFPTKPGDVVFFDGFVPHWAPKNQTDKHRRIVFLTYNPESQGDKRAEYFADKRDSYPPDNERNQAQEYVFRV